MPELIDSHGHLNLMPGPDTLDDVIGRAREAGIVQVVVPGVDVPSSRRALSMAQSRPGLFAVAGLHPHEANTLTDEMISEFREIAADPLCVAIGETGMDYHYDNSPRDEQMDAFRRQLALAREIEKPVVIHMRDAWEDCFRILGEAPRPEKGVFHCFTGGPDEARRACEIGYHVSFSGIATFRNGEKIRDAVEVCDPELVVVETDAPFLAPQPHRGKKNEPAFMVHTAKVVAKRMRMDPDAFAALATENTRRLFGIPADRVLGDA